MTQYCKYLMCVFVKNIVNQFKTSSLQQNITKYRLNVEIYLHYAIGGYVQISFHILLCIWNFTLLGGTVGELLIKRIKFHIYYVVATVVAVTSAVVSFMRIIWTVFLIID